MTTHIHRKLVLNRDTIRTLDSAEIDGVRGGISTVSPGASHRDSVATTAASPSSRDNMTSAAVSTPPGDARLNDHGGGRIEHRGGDVG
jgi:hypothetical protein